MNDHRRTDIARLWLYCIAHALTPVTLAAGFMLTLHLYGAVSLAPAIALTVGALAAHIPATLIEVYGGAKERAAARTYVGAYWTVLIVAVVLLAVAEHSGQPADWTVARQAGSLAVFGVLTTMVAHAKTAAEVMAVPTFDGADTTGLAARIAEVAAERDARAARLPGRLAYVALLLAATCFAISMTMLPLIAPSADSVHAMLVWAAPTILAAAGTSAARRARAVLTAVARTA